jgi:flagellar biosynthesis protein FliQ
MAPDLPERLFRDGLLLLSYVGAPMLAALLGVGLVVGVLQAATQVNDPSVSAVPRLAAAVGVAAVLGRWMVEKLAQFLQHSLTQLGGP